MALIPAVGRKSLKMRTLVFFLYVVLTIGAVIMVYPFLVMLGSSVASQVDQAHYDIVPRYLYSSPALFGKYVEDKYDADMVKLNAAYGAQYAKLDNVMPPAPIAPERIRAWDTFAAGLPMHFKSGGFGGGTGISYSPSPLLDRYIAFLRTRFHSNIQVMDRAYAQEDELFETAIPPFEQPTKQSWTPGITPKDTDWAAFEQTLPAHYFVVIGADPIYRTWLKEEVYPHPSDLSKAWGTNITDFNQVTLSVHPMGNAAQRRDWETFVRTKLPFRDVHVDGSALPQYQQFLASRYGGKIGLLNTRYGATLGSFSQAVMPNPDGIIPPGPPLLDWLDFLKAAPLSILSVDTPETRWRTYAQNQFHLSDTEATTMPLLQPQSDWAYMQAHLWELRRSYLTRNYSLVLQYMLLHGRAVWNTVLYCSLAVLIALIVNPLCAYALSRYNLSYGSSVLLFLLATMAFPAEVTMIPNFLLLKDLGLLNTFSALVLPTAAKARPWRELRNP